MDETSRQPKETASSVATAMAMLIYNGHYAPGAILPGTRDLAKHFACSETIIQNVLGGLSISGAISPAEGACFKVNQPSHDPIEAIRSGYSILEFRSAMEQEAAALAAHRRTDEDVRALHAALADMQAIDFDAVEKYARSDLNLHVAIIKASGNPLFFQVLTPLLEEAVRDNHQRQRQYQHASRRAFLKRMHREHGRIVDAIVYGDAGDARRQMKRHFQLPLRRYRSLLGMGNDSSG